MERVLLFQSSKEAGKMLAGILAENWWAVSLRGVLAICFGLFALTTPAPRSRFWSRFLVFMRSQMVCSRLFPERRGEGLKSAGECRSFEVFWNSRGGHCFHLSWRHCCCAFLCDWRVGDCYRSHGDCGCNRVSRKAIKGEWLLGLAGVLSIAFGLMIMVNPLVGMLAITSLIGVYALIAGGLLLGAGLKLRSLREQIRIQEQYLRPGRAA